MPPPPEEMFLLCSALHQDVFLVFNSASEAVKSGLASEGAVSVSRIKVYLSEVLAGNHSERSIHSMMRKCGAQVDLTGRYKDLFSELSKDL